MGKTKNKQFGDAFFDAVGHVSLFLLEANTKILLQGIRKMRFGERTIMLLLGSFLVAALMVNYDFHLHFLLWLQPKIFTYNLMVKIKTLGWWTNTFGVTGMFFSTIVWSVGVWQMIKLRRYQDELDAVYLKNGQGKNAKVVDVVSLNNGQKIIKVYSQGIGIGSFQKAKEALESAFSSSIEKIQHSATSMKYTEIVLGAIPLPKKVYFAEVEEELSKPNQFIIGMGRNEVFKEQIDHLPHMLVAGTTGGGKSVFFKQALLGLLETTDNLQMYLIDLKGGLEFKSFKVLPNVKVVKTIEDAIAVLSAVKTEMEARFDYLEESDKEKIVPGKDPFDRIVVGIDEASVLYAKTSKDDDDYELVVKARILTEHIAKLSRAAGINLIMATQKVTKETIDTRIQENISGRMCFKLNTLEGSLRVLGNGSACDLPGLPGRGIWQLGNQSLEVQTPFLDSEYLKETLECIAVNYEMGRKKFQQKMLGEENEQLHTLNTINHDNQRRAFEEI